MSKDRLIRDAFADFILSRKALRRTSKTIEFYEYTIGAFMQWLGDKTPTVRDVRIYLAHLTCADATVHAHARGIRAFLRFCHQEGWIDEPVRVQMPKVAQKRQPVLDAEQLHRLFSACRSSRDKALVLLMVDTGLRRNETLSLTWDDVDMSTGLVHVVGKGGKHRSVVLGVKSRRALLKHRRGNREDRLFTLRPSGLRQVFRRLSKRAGVYCTPHILRRTFATMYLKAQGDVITLQMLMGHSSLETTRRYVTLTDEDLVTAHQAHGPVDRFIS